MDESSSLYVKNIKKKMDTIFNSNQYTVDQQFVAFYQVCEDLLLLKELPITKTIKSLYDEDKRIVDEINSNAKRMNEIIDGNEEVKKIRETLKELGEERYDNIKNFFKNFKKL